MRLRYILEMSSISSNRALLHVQLIYLFYPCTFIIFRIFYYYILTLVNLTDHRFKKRSTDTGTYPANQTTQINRYGENLKMLQN